jgi:hypothetical protein
MNDRHLLRLAAVAAVAGAAASLLATAFEPDASGKPADAVRVAAGSGIWNGDRLLDLIGIFLTVAALTVVGRTFAGGPAREWASIASPFLVLMGALGAGAVIAGAGVKEMADAWAGAPPGARQSYLTAFQASRNAADDLFFAAFLALGLYLVLLAAAITAGHRYARWIGYAAALSGALVTAGDLLVLVSDAAFVAVLAGYVIFLAVLVALGTSMWRQAPALRDTGSPTAQSLLTPAMTR